MLSHDLKLMAATFNDSVTFPDEPQIYFEVGTPGSHYLSIRVGIKDT